MPGAVVHAYIPVTWEVDAGRSQFSEKEEGRKDGREGKGEEKKNLQ